MTKPRMPAKTELFCGPIRNFIEALDDSQEAVVCCRVLRPMFVDPAEATIEPGGTTGHPSFGRDAAVHVPVRLGRIIHIEVLNLNRSERLSCEKFPHSKRQIAAVTQESLQPI